jgi:hypothetical protein
MKQRYLDVVFQAYLKENKISLEEITPVGDDGGYERFQEKIKDMSFPEIQEVSSPTITVGELCYNDEVGHFIITGIGQSYFEVIKVSTYVDLGNQNDFYFQIGDNSYIAEIWNNFYLTKEEITKSALVGKTPTDDMEIICDEDHDLPEGRHGLTVPIGDLKFVQNKFHSEEIKKVKEFAMRILNILAED